MRTSRYCCAIPVSSMYPIPPKTCSAVEQRSTALSVHQPFTTGIISSTKARCSLRTFSSGWRCEKSSDAAVTYASARIASIVAFCHISMRRTSGCLTIASGALDPRFDVAALHAFLGILERALVRAVGERDALNADRKARRVHHHEHVLEAAVGFADEIADRAFAAFADAHRARRVAVDAQLVLDAGADHLVGLAERAVVVHDELRHDEERNALGSFGRVRQPRENEMNDVLGHVVLAEGDEDLLAGEPVLVAVGHRFRAHLREVRTGLRLGETHRARPLSGDEIGNESLLLLFGSLRVRSLRSRPD